MAADNNLNTPVVIAARQIEASSLPVGLSPAYTEYVIRQSSDLGSVAGKANDAGKGAYDAQVKNDEQDAELADHEARIDAAEVTLGNHELRITANTAAIGLLEVRLTTAEGKIVVLRSDVDYLLDEVIDIQAEIVAIDGRLDTAEADIDNLQTDYVSKSAVASQSLASPLNVVDSYSVDSLKVLGPRQAGWTAATGTALLGAFNANQTFTVSNPPTQAEVQAIANALVENRQRTKALEDALRTHGQIN